MSGVGWFGCHLIPRRSAVSGLGQLHKQRVHPSSGITEAIRMVLSGLAFSSEQDLETDNTRAKNHRPKGGIMTKQGAVFFCFNCFLTFSLGPQDFTFVSLFYFLYCSLISQSRGHSFFASPVNAFISILQYGQVPRFSSKPSYIFAGHLGCPA